VWRGFGGVSVVLDRCFVLSMHYRVFYKLKSAQFIIEKVPTLKVATLKLLSKRGPFY
jgi:hypothetical protein